MIAEADLNGDGLINFQEFTHLMQAQQQMQVLQQMLLNSNKAGGQFATMPPPARRQARRVRPGSNGQK